MDTRNTRTALFAGSFDPFTIGHKSIIDRALASVADEVVVAIGVNINKRSATSLDERVAAIERIYAGDSRVKVRCYDGLTTDFAKSVGASFLLRGVRSVKDFEYEREIADVNRMLTGIETVLLFAEPQLSSVASSTVRELMAYGKDVSAFLPKQSSTNE